MAILLPRLAASLQHCLFPRLSYTPCIRRSGLLEPLRPVGPQITGTLVGETTITTSFTQQPPVATSVPVRTSKFWGGNQSMESLNRFSKLLALAVLCAGAAWANNPGMLQGVVKGADGKPVSGAYVKVIDSDGLTMMVVSRAQGKFSANNLKPGKYTVQAMGGEMQSKTESVDVSGSKPGAADLSLERTSRSRTCSRMARHARNCGRRRSLEQELRVRRFPTVPAKKSPSRSAASATPIAGS